MEPFNEIEHNNSKPTTRFNPFPGLRPFTTDESHLFFGREGQSQEVLKYLADNKFVALLGTSGSGKSSLMYCGVIPILQGGFITKAGANWQVITCRPGQSPIRNLAVALSDHTTTEADSKELQNEFLYSTLSASSRGLSEALSHVPRKKDENILLLVDQFEELFRFRRIKNSVEATNEVLAYIKLLIEVLNKKDNSVYIVLTMRSDFIGECAQFQDLTQLINDSHYLIPQMTRDNFREAIEGPIAVGGGKITPFLIQQLLNDIGDNPDQLPILQHALMRTWDAWVRSGRIDEPIDIKDYESIGKLGKALSEHANEAFNELSQREKNICQSVFKTLTEKAGDDRGVRRPTPIVEVADIAIATPEEVMRVIEHFRKAGRSFLSPGGTVKLNANTVIDISHESLMRIWDKLIIWVSEEFEAVQMYKRLSASSEKYQLGETALWRPPDLQLAINWREKQLPTLTWARRHNPAFERTMVYLETSQKEYQLEEQNKIKQQKRALRRTRMFAVVLGTASIISIFFMINSVVASQEAEKQRLKAEEETVKAEKQTFIAEAATLQAQESEKDAVAQKELAEEQRVKAQKSERNAVWQQKIATKKSKEAAEEKQKAEQSAVEAKKQARIAGEASSAAQKLRMLSISQSMAVKSEQIDIDTTLKALVAFQSYQFNNEYGGNLFNSDVYNGLYYAQKYFYGNELTDFSGHVDQVRAFALDNNSNSFYSTGSGGKVFLWNQENTKDLATFYDTENINRAIELSPDGSKLFLGIGNGNVMVLNVKDTSLANKVIYQHKHAVTCGMFITNNKLLSVSSKGLWALSDINTGKTSEFFEHLPIKKIYKHNEDYWAVGSQGFVLNITSFSPFEYKKYAVVFSEDGKESSFVEIALEDKTEITDRTKINALALSENSKYLTLGNIDGSILVWDFSKMEFLRRLTGHTARINEIRFDNSGAYMASASNDGKIIVWSTQDLNLPPLLLSDNDAWVTTIDFNKDGTALLAGYRDGKIRKWSTLFEPIANKVKAKINRNFSLEEWQQYVAKDIDYEKTIESLPEN